MFFKINPTGCGERKGLAEVRFDLYLEPVDYGHSEHYVQVPVWPPGGYPGAVGEGGVPVDQADFDLWLAALPRVWQHNPFCCHFFQFEPIVTNEEILAKGDEVLAMAYQNWQVGDLRLNKNPKVTFSDDPAKKAAAVARAEQIKTTDFTKVKGANKTKVKAYGDY